MYKSYPSEGKIIIYILFKNKLHQKSKTLHIIYKHHTN